MTETLAIIPCRGGSKRLPGKNIRPMHGRPMIAYTIQAALDAPSVDRVIVSTDDEDIRGVAIAHSHGPDGKHARDESWNGGKCWGHVAPFLRPAHLATDDATSEDVVLHCLDWLAEHEDYHPDRIVLLQATSPLRTAVDVEGALRVEFVRSVVSTNWQDSEKRNGAIYITTTRIIRDWEAGKMGKDLWDGDAIDLPGVQQSWPWCMPWHRSVDVDTIEDFELAEWLMSQRGM